MDIGTGAMSQRKLSLTLQLSPPEAYEGGGLEFFGAGELSVSRLQGTLIAFPSFLHHRVTPITRGKRESLVMWWHGPAFR
jgi:PKHD-type hydroxylase